jgi:hypothetical protein
MTVGAWTGGVGLTWKAVGWLVLVVGIDVAPANIPGEVRFAALKVAIRHKRCPLRATPPFLTHCPSVTFDHSSSDSIETAPF